MTFALFTKVNGRWRFEGFTVDPDGSARAAFIRAVNAEVSESYRCPHPDRTYSDQPPNHGTTAYKIINLDE